MNEQNDTVAAAETVLQFNLGTFEGFNFRSQSAIDRILTAAEVVEWDHDRQGEAEFWPSGDRREVALIFEHRTSISASELLALDRLLEELGGDSVENFLRIHHALEIGVGDLAGLSREAVEDESLEVFLGSNFTDLRREVAYELFELYYPEAYRAWEQSACDGLIFDTNRFLDSPGLWVEEVRLGDQVALLVAPR